MSSADNIARTILEMGQIRAQGLERAAEATARAQANSGQIWGGAIAQLGQIPGEIAKYKLADTENQIRQQQLDRAKQQQNDEFNASQIFGYVTRPTQDGSTQFNEERLNDLAQRMAGAGIHPETQQKMFSAFKQGNEIIDSFRQEQLAHQARFAQAVLDSATPDNPLTPSSALMAAKVAQANGLGNAQDIDKFMQAINQGHDPTEVFKAIVKAGTHPKEQKFGTAAPGSVIFNEVTGQPAFQAPERPPAPGTGQHVINGQLVGPDGQPIGAPIPPQKEATPEPLVSVKTMENGKPVEKFIPRSQAAGQTFPSQPPASVIYPKPEVGTSPEITLKPGTQQYRVAQDVAYGALTMADFNRIYGRAMGNAATKQAIYDTARQLNPAFNPAQFELGFKMASNPQIRQRVVAIDALGPVIDKINDISAKVGNGDVQLFNRLLQGAKIQISNKTVANFQQLKTLLGDEAGIALGVGTGSDLKTKLGLDLVNTNLSDGSFQSNMEQLRSILGSRKDLLLNQMGPYASAAGGAPAAGAPATPAAPPPPQGQPGNPLGLVRPGR